MLRAMQMLKRILESKLETTLRFKARGLRSGLFCILFFMALVGGSMNAETKIQSVEINGVAVPLLFEQSKNLPVGSVQLVFIGGSADGAKAGLGNLSAKILNEGTKDLGSVEFAKRLESKAISLYASVGLQTLNLELSYLKEFQNESFTLLNELLKQPNLTQEALSKVKTLTLNKLAQQEDDFDSIAEKNLYKILFEGTAMATPLLGDKQSVESVSLQDVEQFLQRNLVLKRLIIVAGGDLQENEFKTTLIKALSTLPVGESKEKLSFEAIQTPKNISSKKPTQQAFVYFGSRFDNADKTKIIWQGL